MMRVLWALVRWLGGIGLVAAELAAGLAAGPAMGEPRSALVMGNGAYGSVKGWPIRSAMPN